MAKRTSKKETVTIYVAVNNGEMIMDCISEGSFTEDKKYFDSAFESDYMATVTISLDKIEKVSLQEESIPKLV